MSKSRRKKLHGCQKAIIPPPRIGSDRGTKMEYDLIIQLENSLSQGKQPKAGRRVSGKKATLAAGTKIEVRSQDAAQTV